MKITLFLIFLAFNLYSLADGKKAKNSLAEDNLKGKVRSINEQSFSAVEKFGEIANGSLLYETIFNYDSKGNITELYANSNKFIYLYDSNGNEIEESFIPASGSGYKVIKNYDVNRNLTDKTYYKSTGILSEKYTYKYDTKGNEIEENRYYEDGTLNYKEKSKYDTYGNMLERITYNADGSQKFRFIYKYDNKGNMLENFEPLTNEFMRWKYDAYGNEIEFHDSGRPVISYKYEYDSTGNWIRKIEYKGFQPLEIIERVIEYYP